jgi:hypothetical protein
VRLVLPVALLTAMGAVMVAGCSEPAPPPEVTFAADGSTVTARPTQYCDVNVQDCQADPKAAVTLRVPPGQPLEVSVPGSVSEAPWQVVFRYRSKDGTSAQARSTVFAAGERSAYTLRLPEEQAQLETVEVQQFGAAMVPREDGVDFATRATWVLSVDDRAQ